MALLGVTKKGWATPRLATFRGLIQKFRRASLPLSYGRPPPPPPRLYIWRDNLKTSAVYEFFISTYSTGRVMMNITYFSERDRIVLACACRLIYSRPLVIGSFENEDRSTKHPKLENEAPKSRKRSTQISKTKHCVIRSDQIQAEFVLG